MAWALQNPKSPDLLTHQGDGIGEGVGRLGTGDPGEVGLSIRGLGKIGEPQRDQRVETEQAWLGPQDGPGGPATCGFEAEVFTDFGEHHFNGPAAGVGFDDLLRRETHVGGEEVLVAVGAGQILDEHPADFDQSFAALVPLRRAGHDRHAAGAAAVPREPKVLASLGLGDDVLRRRSLPPLHRRAAVGAGPASWRQVVEVGVFVKLADQRQPRLAGGEPSQGVRAVVAVADKREFPLRKPAEDHAQQLPHQIAWRLVATT